MRDIGHDETEMLLKEMEKRISKEYAQAEREIAAKLNDYLEKFKVKDELKLKALENGLITEKEYKEWRIGQIMMGQRWAEMRDSLAQDFTNADKIAKSIAFGYQPEVYAINHNYGTFQVEKGSLIDTSYTLYDRHTVQELFKNEDFIPAPGRKIKAAIKEGKALAWNKKSVQSAMMQSILQGESISKIASRVSRTVGESDRKAAIRNARTMTTGVENAGRIASYERANNMGIETRKQWLATLDDRTRHWHADLDGVTVDNDEPFKNEFGEIMFPGDPKADPANIYNCRCTLIASIKGFERDVSNTDLRHDKNLKGMSYDEWKKGHYETKSDSITKQDEIAETMRNVYGAEYASYKRSTPQEEAPVVKIEEPKHPTVDSHIKGVSKNEKSRVEWVEDNLGMSKEEATTSVKAVSSYTLEGDVYSKVHNGEQSAQKEIDAIDSLLKNPNMPVYDGTIYRGVHIDDSDDISALDKVNAIVSNGTWNEPGITSFTTKRDKANQFATGGAHGDEEKGINVLIINKKNVSGCPVQHLSSARPEGEVLVPSDIKDRGYKIVSTKITDKERKVERWHYDEALGRNVDDPPRIYKSKWAIIEVEENDY